jgi:hypothetical protein
MKQALIGHLWGALYLAMVSLPCTWLINSNSPQAFLIASLVVAILGVATIWLTTLPLAWLFHRSRKNFQLPPAVKCYRFGVYLSSGVLLAILLGFLNNALLQSSISAHLSIIYIPFASLNLNPIYNLVYMPWSSILFFLPITLAFALGHYQATRKGQ